MDLYAWKRGIGSTSLLAALLIVATTPLLAPAPAHAADDVVTETPTITVNTTVDTPDANPGNGTCADASGACSLRAAIEESNAKPGPQNVTVPAGTYLLSSRLVVKDDLTVNGAGKDATFIDGNNASQVLHVRTDELLVCDYGNNSVASYDHNGQPNPDFIPAGTGGLDAPLAIEVGPFNDGEDVFVMNGNSGIRRFATTGQYKGIFATSAQAGYVVDGIFGGDDGPWPYLYTANYDVDGGLGVFHHESGGGGTFIMSGTGGLNYPSGVAFYDQDLYATSTGTHEVLRFDGATGNFVGVFADGLNIPRDIVLHNNMLYVANEGSDEVRRYNAETGEEDASAFVTAGSGSLDGPTDLAFGPDGDLYVISRENARILRYNGSTGAFRDVFIQGGTPVLESPSCLKWRYSAGAGPDVTINGVTIQNGNTIISRHGAAGLLVSGGATVALRSSVVRDNDSQIFGGGIGNYGELSLFEVEVRNNTVPIDKTAGQTSGRTAEGGGIYNQGKLTIGRSLIVDNLAQRGAGINNVGSGQINIVNTTISGNKAFGGGGGIRQTGGLININASTITNNYANERFNLGGSADRDPFGGGILITATGRVVMANTILAENDDYRSDFYEEYSPDCYSLKPGRFTSRRDNLVGVLTTNCVLKDMILTNPLQDQVGTPALRLDPELTWLDYYDSDIRVHKLHNTSPALDSNQYEGSNRFFKCPGTDQRGVARPQNGACDIGAFELIQGVNGDRPDDGDVTDEPRPDPNAPRLPTAPTARPGAATAPATPTAAAATATAPTATAEAATTTAPASPTAEATTYPAPEQTTSP
jgi:CSLREA domain-containing protein